MQMRIKINLSSYWLRGLIMNMKDAVKSVIFKKYATFSGRASRSEYWWFGLAYLLVYIGTMILDNIFGTTYDSQSPDCLLYTSDAADE